jgi:leader peptidase (prepilin peptidase)/N-methyltransferase
MELVAERAPFLLDAFAFAFGAVVGSFLNVVIARLPAGESLVSPGSRCPRCRTPIAWYDNVPILGWLWLRGRCRACGLPISIRYPVVELLVALLAVAIERKFGPTATAVGFFAFVAALVALSYIDLDTWLLPHEITWPLIGVGLLSPLWNESLRFSDSIIGAAAGGGFFAAIALFGEKVLKRETMGWGDVYLLGGIGAWLGWQSLLAVVLFSAIQGSIVGVLLLWLKGSHAAEQTPDVGGKPEAAAVGKTKEDAPPHPASDDDWVPPPHAVPFGPFLALAALEQLLVGALVQATWFGWLERLWG